MNVARTGLVVVAAIAACAVGGAADQSQTRDAISVRVVGTGSIAGTVVSADQSRAPVRRVLLSLTRVAPNDVRVTATDDAGRYLFDRLPAGTYRLSAAKGAYVGANYGSLNAGMPGSAIPLAEGQHFNAAAIPLVRGAVITGRVISEQGHPIAGATMLATQVIVTRRQQFEEDPRSDEPPAVDASAGQDVTAGLADVWQSLLGVTAVAAEDDFFSLGGHSLLATSVIFHIRQKWGCTVSLDDVFRHSTFAAQVALIEGRVTTGDREALLL